MLILSSPIIPFPRERWGMRSPAHRKDGEGNSGQHSMVILLMKAEMDYIKGGNQDDDQLGGIIEGVLS